MGAHGSVHATPPGTAPTEPDQFPRFLTVEQAAAMLQISTDTIYRWSSQGLLSGIKSRGTPLRLDRDKLITWYFETRRRPRRRRGGARR